MKDPQTNLRVEFVESASLISSELWERCFPSPLEGQWWYETLERADLSEQFTFFYAVIHEHTRMVGIAPIFLMNLPLSVIAPDGLVPLVERLEDLSPSLMRPRTLFVGSPCSDEGTVGLVPDVDRTAALHCVHRAIEKKAQQMQAAILVWKDFPSSYVEPLTEARFQTGLFRVVSFPGTVLALPNTKEAYLRALSSSRRQHLKRMLRRGAERIKVDAQCVQQPDGKTIDEIFGLFWQTYEHGKTKFEKLNRRFFEIIAQQPVAYFILLKESETRKMVAFMLCFLLGERVINKFIGIDHTLPKNYFLHALLWDAAVEWAMEVGATSIQSGQTGYATKILTGHRLVPLNNFCRHNNSVANAIYRLVGQRIRWESLDNDLHIIIKAHSDIATHQL
jgi:hypothetical protein